MIRKFIYIISILLFNLISLKAQIKNWRWKDHTIRIQLGVDRNLVDWMYLEVSAPVKKKITIEVFNFFNDRLFKKEIHIDPFLTCELDYNFYEHPPGIYCVRVKLDKKYVLYQPFDILDHDNKILRILQISLPGLPILPGLPRDTFLPDLTEEQLLRKTI